MPSFTRPLILNLLLAHALLFLAGFAFSEEKLPADAAKLVEAFDTDAAKMRAETEKAIEKKAALLANALQKAQDTATKKGDLDGAMAIKAKIAALGVKGGSTAPVADAARLVHAVPRMTGKEWDEIPGEPIVVLATKASTDTSITLSADDTYVLVPNPVDQWTCGPADKYTKVRWDAGEQHLCWKVGNGAMMSTTEKDGLIVRGEGALVLMGADANCGDNWGSVRVKIVRAK
jgi:hypothetical protein